MTDSKPGNALASQTSPYLLQHASNPVHWYPWERHALALAKAEDRPILLSIGYSACHWCHVMAHESFEDPATAAVMNRLFVNIKVDREERPDLDKVYQTAHQLLTGRPGGWPLTLFLTPDRQIPFFAGTYFPARPRHRLPAFVDLMQQVADFYRTRPGDIEQQGRSLLRAMAEPPAGAEPSIDPGPLDEVYRQLADSFDGRDAGFGRAPKFPHPTSLTRLLHHALDERPERAERRGRQALTMVTATLDRMALGGVYDQLGGGFFRYSVDDQWAIPHFEKMLYDNALLLALYAEAWQLHPSPLYRQVVAETGAWVIGQMQSPQGGYWSTLDADSDGVEGQYYLWTRDQVEAALDPDEYRLLAGRFGLDSGPNFADRWHLGVGPRARRRADQHGMPAGPQRAALDRARAKLLRVRRQRRAPDRDEKVLAAWNGLMIKGMAVAARVFDAPELEASARRALDFVRSRLWRDGRLLATYKDGQARLDAYLDDHAFLIDATLALLELRWDGAGLCFARALADRLLDAFVDPARGGFFFTADDQQALFHRPKPFSDDALPSGNAVAARTLQRLGNLLAEPRYLAAAEAALRAAWSQLRASPVGHEAMLEVLAEQLSPPLVVVLRADGDAAGRWRARIHAAGRHCTLYPVPADAKDLPEALRLKPARADHPLAYPCRGQHCLSPVTSVEALLALLEP